MKKLSFLIASLFLAALGMILVACTEPQIVSLTASNNVYSHGEQTVEITVSDTDASGCTFEEGISASDVTAGDGLAGKTVTSVKYVDAKTISVTLSGTVTAEVGNEGILGSLTVSGGMTDGGTGTAYLTVYKPQMTTSSVSSSSMGGVYSFSSTFKLPYGSFVEGELGGITLPDDNGVLETSLTAAGELKVTVREFTPTAEFSHPVVMIPAGATTFAKELYVYVGVDALQGSGYDLV